MNKIFLILIGFIVFAVNINASESAKIFFDRGVRFYLRGDVDSAIENVEAAVEMSPDDEKMMAFLIKMLIERGNHFYELNKYEDAMRYIKKARKLQPENKEVQDIFTILESELRPEEKEVVVPRKIVLDDGTTKEVMVSVGVGEERTRMMASLLESAQKRQDKLIEAYTEPHDTLRQIITKSDEERARLLSMIDAREREIAKAFDEERKARTQTVYFTIGGVVAGIGLIMFLVWFVFGKIAAQREQMLMQQQERILGMVQQQTLALTQGNVQLQRLPAPGQTAIPQGDTISPKEMLNDNNPRVRAKGIEIVETELENEENPEVAERILEPFLEDKDNRVKANAIKVLYKYNRNKSIKALLDMLSSDDKWEKVSASWAFGEIGDPELLKHLMENVDADDFHIKRMILKSMKKILLKNKDKAEDEKIKNVQELLNKIQVKEGWVL